MKILSKEQEEEHYNATIKGGAIGGAIGLTIGATGVAIASKRSHAFSQLTLPFKAFLASSSGTFVAIVAADRASHDYEVARRARQREYRNTRETAQEQIRAAKGSSQRAREWLVEYRYPLLFGAWVASMGGSFYVVNRNRYLKGAQKLVQARVYAQFLTIGLLLGSFALESKDALLGKGRWDTVQVVDPDDPSGRNLIEKKVHRERYKGEDQWMDMVAAEDKKRRAAETQRKTTTTTAAEEGG